MRKLPADQDSDQDRDQYLNIKYLVPGFRHLRRCSGCDHCRHDVSLPLKESPPQKRADFSVALAGRSVPPNTAEINYRVLEPGEALAKPLRDARDGVAHFLSRTRIGKTD